MTRHNELLYLGHIFDMSKVALKIADGRIREDLDLNLEFQLAILHAVQILGEAATRLSKETRSQLSGVPWNEIIGMRNVIVHGYASVDLDRVWQTVTEDLQRLIEELEPI